MANGASRKDPLPAFVFKIDLTLSGGSASAFFKSVGGLSYETEAQELKEGGVNHMTYKLVGGTKFKNLTFKRGFTADSEILKWKDDWQKFATNGGSAPARITGTISQLDSGLNEVKKWQFTRGWPAKWELSELDAGKNEVAIETLEIAHEGLTILK